jgi:hypothetical protein
MLLFVILGIAAFAIGLVGWRLDKPHRESAPARLSQPVLSVPTLSIRLSHCRTPMARAAAEGRVEQFVGPSGSCAGESR